MSNAIPLNFSPQRILVISQRYLGDTLLITPLIHSLRLAYPDAHIDVLIPDANQGILEGNPDINHIRVFPALNGALALFKLLRSLFRQYDLAISLQNSDRTTLCAILAANYSLGFIDTNTRKSWWKKWFLSGYLFPGQNHTVLENLGFCHFLGITPVSNVIAPCNPIDSSTSTPDSAYAVLHIMPQWRFKQWHLQGWRDVIAYLQQQQLEVILTGSPQTDELAFIQEFIRSIELPIINLAGRLSLAELSLLIQKARVFIGPDTGITHLAAATGTATIALFGPTNPTQWAPWPKDYQASCNPFHARGTQQVKNVWLLQDSNSKSCIPCQLEGCEKHRLSHSACLDDLPSTEVIAALHDALYGR